MVAAGAGVAARSPSTATPDTNRYFMISLRRRSGVEHAKAPALSLTKPSLDHSRLNSNNILL